MIKITRRNAISGAMMLGLMSTTRFANAAAPAMNAMTKDQLLSAWTYWLYQENEGAMEQAAFFRDRWLEANRRF